MVYDPQAKTTNERNPVMGADPASKAEEKKTADGVLASSCDAKSPAAYHSSHPIFSSNSQTLSFL